MIGYRPFLNTDPPALADIWNAQPPARGLMQPMTAAALDELVLSKPYFDRYGLLVACDDRRPVGFAHVGFGPRADYSGLDWECGIVAALMVADHPQQAEISAELLAQSERYLVAHGARESFGGCVHGWNPYYLGLYGGAGSPGVLTTDQGALQALQAAGYQPEQQRTIAQRGLAGFRSPVDRALIELKRKLQLVISVDGAARSWWHDRLFAHAERIHCAAVLRSGEPIGAAASFWDIEPLASTWGVHAVGLADLQVQSELPEPEQLALSTHVLAESFRQLQSQGITLAEIQFRTDDRLLSQVARRLGFSDVGHAVTLRRTLV